MPLRWRSPEGQIWRCIDATNSRASVEMAKVLVLSCPQPPIVAVIEAATGGRGGSAALEAGIRGCVRQGAEGDDSPVAHSYEASVKVRLIYRPSLAQWDAAPKPKRLNGAT